VSSKKVQINSFYEFTRRDVIAQVKEVNEFFYHMLLQLAEVDTPLRQSMGINPDRSSTIKDNRCKIKAIQKFNPPKQED